MLSALKPDAPRQQPILPAQNQAFYRRSTRALNAEKNALMVPVVIVKLYSPPPRGLAPA